MRIFLAGSENLDHTEVLAALKYPHRLASYLAMRDGAKQREKVLEHVRDGSEWILDSGLFSLMFGARKGELKTREAYWEYAERYLREVDEWSWPHVIVECDVQRVLDVATCNEMRDQLFRQSGREVIYVWHIPEGEDGLRALAEREHRIALSVPELRAVYGTGFAGGQRVRAALIRLLAIVKQYGQPGQRVHLLGNTESVLLTLPADSCDSTSWIAAGVWGIGAVYDPTRRAIDYISTHSPKWKVWRKWCSETAPEVVGVAQSESRRDMACSAIACKMLLEAHQAPMVFP